MGPFSQCLPFACITTCSPSAIKRSGVKHDGPRRKPRIAATNNLRSPGLAAIHADDRVPMIVHIDVVAQTSSNAPPLTWRLRRTVLEQALFGRVIALSVEDDGSCEISASNQAESFEQGTRRPARLSSGGPSRRAVYALRINPLEVSCR